MLNDQRMKQPNVPLAPSDGLQREGPIGVVISGAGARGAYEAGVLAELMPRLFTNETLDRAILVGTSAGAVNAALWAFYADGKRSLWQVGKLVCDFWEKFDQPHVFQLRVLKVLAGIGRISSLLDTSPLERSALELMRADDPKLPITPTTPLSKGRIGTIGVVATSCAAEAAGGRSKVFFNGNAQDPVAEADGAIDYIRESVTLEHVIASAAIPILFPPAKVSNPANEAGYYTDGGVRLNTPIAPALKLGAKRVVVVSSHTTRYPEAARPSQAMPDVLDVGSQALYALLADGMIEDLRTLKRINKFVSDARDKPLRSANGRHYHEVELIEASPVPGTLARLAHESLSSSGEGLRGKRIWLFYQWLRIALAGVGTGTADDELLSYLLFEQRYAQKQIAAGRAEGMRAAAENWHLTDARQASA